MKGWGGPRRSALTHISSLLQARSGKTEEENNSGTEAGRRELGVNSYSQESVKFINEKGFLFFLKEAFKLLAQIPELISRLQTEQEESCRRCIFPVVSCGLNLRRLQRRV